MGQTQEPENRKVTQKFTGHRYNKLTWDFENSTDKLHSKMVVKANLFNLEG